MKIAFMVIFGLGWLIAFVGSIMFIVAAFRVSIWWGLAVLFLPLANLIFLINHWSEARKAFFTQLGGVCLGIVAIVIAGATTAKSLACGMKRFPMDIPQGAGSEEFVQEKEASVQESSVDWGDSGSVHESTPEADWGEGGTADNFVGMTLKDVENILGKPKGIMKTSDKTIYKYSNLELVSDDGITVTSQSEY